MIGSIYLRRLSPVPVGTNRRGITLRTSSEIAFEGVVPLMWWLFGFNHIGFVPFALAKSLHADQVNAFPSLFFYKADALVLYILYSVAHLKFWIAHIFSLGHQQNGESVHVRRKAN